MSHCLQTSITEQPHLEKLDCQVDCYCCNTRKISGKHQSVVTGGGKKKKKKFSNLESLVRIMIPRRGMKIHNFLCPALKLCREWNFINS
jgi:hypothetical protein